MKIMVQFMWVSSFKYECDGLLPVGWWFALSGGFDTSLLTVSLLTTVIWQQTQYQLLI